MRNFAQANRREYNNVSVDGLLFDHNLSKQTSRGGVDYIRGEIEIATDSDCVNVVKINFMYVPAVTKSGKKSMTYDNLEKVINGEFASVKNGGVASATFLRVDGQIEKNDFVSSQTKEIIEATRISGSFVNEGARDNGHATFVADMLITNYSERESNFDNDTYGVIKGFIFNYRNEFLPVQFNVPNDNGGMEYFASQEISNDNPLLISVGGNITTTVKAVESETAFGVRSSSRSLHSWDITSAGNPYVESGSFDDNPIMTFDDIKDGIAKRAEHLAEVRRQWEERQQNSFANSGTEKKVSKNYQF